MLDENIRHDSGSFLFQMNEEKVEDASITSSRIN